MHAVILAGGVGSRLWPLSREKHPKQLHRFDGEYTLLQETLLRVNDMVPLSRMLLVIGSEHAAAIEAQVRQLTGNEGGEVTMLPEPVGRNTAPAIALALFHLKHQGLEEETVVVLPSDHVIRGREAFREALEAGSEAASEGWLVTFGINPDRPETGYGYIKINPREVSPGACQVEKFVEKPDLDTARSYLEEGGYCWNSGMFMFNVSAALEEFRKHLPQVYETFLNCNLKEGRLEEMYRELESISIDYGVMERSGRVAVVPADLGWSDIGSWEHLYRMLEGDENGNVLQGKVMTVESRNNLVISRDQLTALVGLEEMVVVNTGDALLVCPRERSQEVKKVVEKLQEDRADEYQVHKTVDKPWGYYTVLEKGPRYKIKRVLVHPGQKLSKQMHRYRTEHWVVVSGTARIVNGEKEFYLRTNESTFIPRETLHRLENPGDEPLEIIEVQSGDYLEEDDVVRYSDEYGRV